MHGQIILGVGNHIVAVFQEAGKQQFKVAVANDAVEDALFRDEVALILRHEGARLPQLDRVADFGVTFVLHGEGVDRLLEGFDQGLGGRQFG